MTETKHSRIPLAAVAILCILGLLCSCQTVSLPGDNSHSTPSGGSPSGTVSDTLLTLAYTATDSLNPFRAKTKTNQELSRLLYDGLIVLGTDYKPEYRLAQDIKIQGTSVTVSLREAYFSDGSRVTAEDVLASMEAAMQAENLSYRQDFANVTQKTVTQSGNLSLKLAYEDPYFINFLDFPIYKKGSEDEQNTDNKDLPPIGSGRYVYHEEAGEYWLTANAHWVGGEVSMGRIDLMNLPDDDAINHAVQVGTVDWCYSDLSDNTFPGMNGVSKMVPLSNLVYLGANMQSGIMSIRNIRLGVSAAVSRSDVAENAYFGVATPAAGPYPSGVEEATGLQSLSADGDSTLAAEYFEKAGFKRLNGDGYRTNGSSTLSLLIIYNKENTARESMARLLAAQLKTVGCKVSTRALSFEAYQSAVQNGQYDIYIGEMQIPDNLDLYPLITAGGLLTPDVSEPDSAGESDSPQEQGADGSFFGTVESDEATLTAARAAYRYHTGKGSLTEMLSCINEQLPIIPICHRTGMLIYASFLSGEPDPIPSDPFHGIEHCTVQ